ncbi:MAG: PilN domain-containing protein [Neomegalonema sp.]|nr:PilN domain-containing protein [Neomegalonema sp.]
MSAQFLLLGKPAEGLWRRLGRLSAWWRREIVSDAPSHALLLEDPPQLMKVGSGEGEAWQRARPDEPGIARIRLVLPSQALLPLDLAGTPKLSDGEITRAMRLRLGTLSPLPAERSALAFERLEDGAIRLVLADRDLLVSLRRSDAPWRAMLTQGDAAQISDISADLEGRCSFDGSDGAGRGQFRPMRKAALWLAGLAALVFVIAHAGKGLQDQRINAALSAEIAQMETRVQPIRQNAARLAALEAQQQAQLRARSGRRIATAVLLAHLTEALPDHVWLDRLILQVETLTLSGAAPDAAKVLETLSQQSYLRELRFGAATIRREDGLEQFQIQARLIDGPLPALSLDQRLGEGEEER